MTSPTPANLTPDAEERLRVGRAYLMMLLCPFTLHVTSVVAGIMALGALRSASPSQARHYRFQLRVLLGALAWLVLAVVLVVIGGVSFSETRIYGDGGPMSAWTAFYLPTGQALVFAAIACVVISVVWCGGGSLIGLARLMSNSPAPRS